MPPFSLDSTFLVVTFLGAEVLGLTSTFFSLAGFLAAGFACVEDFLTSTFSFFATFGSEAFLATDTDFALVSFETFSSFLGSFSEDDLIDLFSTSSNGWDPISASSI